MSLKILNIEIDGIDKCGKDSIRPYLFQLCPGKYMCRARGLMSQIAYAKLYGRDYTYDATDYCKSTLFVLITVDKDDWKIRCSLTNEPDARCTYEEHCKAFEDAKRELYKFGVPDERIMCFNSSNFTPFYIAKRILARIDYLNSQDYLRDKK